MTIWEQKIMSNCIIIIRLNTNYLIILHPYRPLSTTTNVWFSYCIGSCYCCWGALVTVWASCQDIVTVEICCCNDSLEFFLFWASFSPCWEWFYFSSSIYHFAVTSIQMPWLIQKSSNAFEQYMLLWSVQRVLIVFLISFSTRALKCLNMLKAFEFFLEKIHPYFFSIIINESNYFFTPIRRWFYRPTNIEMNQFQDIFCSLWLFFRELKTMLFLATCSS